MGVGPEGALNRYRGIDRDPLEPFSDEEVAMLDCLVAPRIEYEAQRRLAELEEAGRTDDDFIFHEEDGHAVYALFTCPADYELIWVRDSTVDIEEPDGWLPLGFEPTWFTGDHFSAIGDCLFLPRWHGPDKDGTLFRRNFESLNANGLCETADEAREYLAYYRSLDWTEDGQYVMAEVRGPTIKS
ncbi:MAG TPA: hypothetical protein VIP09_15570 [Dehalococcoidia bacterium]